MSTETPGATPAGLQSERTSLSWTRTSLGLLANGVLLVIRDLHTDRLWANEALAIASAVLAAAVVMVGWSRQRALSRRPLPSRLAARRAVPALGWSVALLCLLTGVVLGL